LSTYKCAREAYTHRFSLEESMLPHLLRFNSLILCSMIINVNWVANLFMMRMDEMDSRPQEDISWRFTVNQPITVHHMEQQPLGSEYEYSFLNGAH
ncbi:hypothetical protein PMAYCL1PPCAC_28082, partial [Pristionchus mayeri]